MKIQKSTWRYGGFLLPIIHFWSREFASFWKHSKVRLYRDFKFNLWILRHWLLDASREIAEGVLAFRPPPMQIATSVASEMKLNHAKLFPTVSHRMKPLQVIFLLFPGFWCSCGRRVMIWYWKYRSYSHRLQHHCQRKSLIKPKDVSFYTTS